MLDRSRQRMVSRWPRLRQVAGAAAVAALLAGCAGYQAYHDGQAKIATGQTDAGLAKLREAMEAAPDNLDYRRNYFAQREAAANSLLHEIDLGIDQGDFAAARQALDKLSHLDPGNARIAAEGERIADEERHARMLDAAMAAAKGGKLESAIATTQQVVSENPNQRRAKAQLRQLLRQQAESSGKELGIYPKLKAAYRVPVSLTFTNASLLQVFEALKQASGLNYMIEREVKPDLKVTLSVTNKPVEDIVRLLLATNQLASRVLDGDTLLIYPNTSAKAAEYQEMVVRSFYLSHGDAAKVAAVVRTLAKARDVVVDEKLNMIMVRDSEDVVRLAEKIVAAQDLPEPEVMLELEVIEVDVNRLLDMGIQWPTSGSVSVIGTDGVLGQLRLSELRNGVRSNMVEVNASNPLISGQLKSTVGGETLLADPRVRVRNKQPAKILIGQRVPVITTTATANVGTSQSVNYLDVGLKLEIQPTISLDDEVAMKVALEVSNIAQTITLAGGTQAYVLGTRNTSTDLQVHDGETNILAGLIQTEKSHSNTGVPGLNEIPLLNRLFGAAEDNDTRTEIVLLITPHIVRSLDIPGIGGQEFLSGTDAAVGGRPIQLGQPDGPGKPGQVGRPSSPAPVQPPGGSPAGGPIGVQRFSPPNPQTASPVPGQFGPQSAPAMPDSAASAPPAGLIQPPLIPKSSGQP